VSRTLRVLAIALGALLVIGEAIRSAGQGRPLAFVLDDFLIGGALIGTGVLFRPDDLRRRAAFAAAWGASSGGLYGSFFGKLLAPPGSTFSSNIPDPLLTALIGAAYAVSLFGMIATIAMKPR
jgi:hypothetical protein